MDVINFNIGLVKTYLKLLQNIRSLIEKLSASLKEEIGGSKNNIKDSFGAFKDSKSANEKNRLKIRRQKVEKY